ncbi:putative O-glycosylation ligase, exosortase A system-associated [Alterisphingorhabdus coralli]|uniref:O-glycosylation ligase, exosortase A system-associated n=1 Tax=Alterisphingorhabdus coralli TaxID=3071408 RepID=A0AA97I1K4_9SPHN|nr:putative O-glycosylation ligase, exosortase A system-associated [Parasphingorhabdus sp. SCSIO 66989]WOE74840.1 putative O-glycosylation ligase, exosortase A system-associated [Parasphingorhabdus sp. SCSIO 66989]
MRDLFFTGFLGLLIMYGLKRPFLFVLTYAYIDIIAPQRMSYYLLNSVPISLIVFVLAFLGYWIADDKRDSRFSARQAMMTLLLLYCAYTTFSLADFPAEASEKWDWVWKALVFAIFLPLTLRTKLRLEALALFLVLSVGTLIITGGIKTAAGGGGYGVLQLLVEDNSGLYEGSIISCVAITIIPLVLWLSKHGTVFPPDWRVKAFAYALIFACLLIPIGTQARTGLVCIAALAVLMLRFNRYRFVYAGLAVAAGIMAVPLLPQSYTDRMATIQDHRSDESASTRVAVWMWTLDYVKDRPLGGGFEAYRGNSLKVERVETNQTGARTSIEVEEYVDSSRAYHSSYFEMLGEQGFPGLILWLGIMGGGIVRMEMVRRRYAKQHKPGEEWVAPFALALQNGQIIYMVGSLFVGIAFQPFIYMLVAMQIGLDTYLDRRRKEAAFRPILQRSRKLAQPAE